MTPHLAFNTAASFTTNTNWQSYAGENTMSYFSQMVALASHNFWSAAVGIAIAAALVRGIARDKPKTIGNFWADLVRLHLYLLIPLCIVYALFLVSQGMIQNFKPYTHGDGGRSDRRAAPGTPAQQIIPQGPMASQVAIKMLGTNGGGFTNANAAHPFENPTPLSNFIQMLSIFAIPSALTYYLGRMVKNQKHGWAVWAAMFVLFLAGVLACWAAEAARQPAHAPSSASPRPTATWKARKSASASSTPPCSPPSPPTPPAARSTRMHDSFTPLGGLVPLFNIHLGEVVFGGVGAGLYGMLVFVVIAIFIAGLMVGRTPEYLGKKIEAYDVKVASLSILILTVHHPGLHRLGVGQPDRGAPAGLNNNGPHGFSEMLYAYTSGDRQQRQRLRRPDRQPTSGDCRRLELQRTLGIDMLLGRFFMIVPILALAGNLAAKKTHSRQRRQLPRRRRRPSSLLLVGTVVIVGALTFVPGLSLGPIVEHFLMHGSEPLF